MISTERVSLSPLFDSDICILEIKLKAVNFKIFLNGTSENTRIYNENFRCNGDLVPGICEALMFQLGCAHIHFDCLYESTAYIHLISHFMTTRTLLKYGD